MKTFGKVVLLISAFVFAVAPLSSQTTATKKPSFEVISIKPAVPNGFGFRGGGARGDKFIMTGSLRMLLQQAYAPPATSGPPSRVEIIGAPNWIDSDIYDIQATADCSGGMIP